MTLQPHPHRPAVRTASGNGEERAAQIDRIQGRLDRLRRFAQYHDGSCGYDGDIENLNAREPPPERRRQPSNPTSILLSMNGRCVRREVGAVSQEGDMENTIMRSDTLSSAAHRCYGHRMPGAHRRRSGECRLSLCERPHVEPVHDASVSGLRRPRHSTVEQQQRPPELPCAHCGKSFAFPTIQR